MSQDDDRRRLPRYPVHAAARFRPLTAETPWTDATLRTAGAGGLFLEVQDDPLPLQTRVEVELPLHEGPVSVCGTVAWLATEPPVGIGVRLDPLPTELEARLLDEIRSGRWVAPPPEEAEARKKKETGLFITDLRKFLESL